MKVYISMLLEERFTARRIMEKFKARGHEITHDWTRMAVPPKCSRRMAELITSIAADKDLQGVMAADMAVWVLPGGRGAAGEFTAGLSHNKYCVIVGRREIGCLFQWHPYVINLPDVQAALDLADQLDKLEKESHEGDKQL